MSSLKKERHLEALIVEKDKQIYKLRASLAAQSSRLDLALEALDSLKIQHGEELATEVQANERLRGTLSRYLNRIKAAENSSDSCRDAVVELTQKVALANHDYASFPHSRIVIPHLLEPLQTMPNNISSAAESELWEYASGTIISLRASLASERRAHAETRSASRARIAVLEAQISRRDTELEECIMNTGLNFPRPSSSRMPPANIPNPPPTPPPISTSEVKAAHRRGLAQNMMLEKEVEELAEQLEKARLKANRVVLPDTRKGVNVDQPPARASDSGRRKRDRHNSQPGDAGSSRQRSANSQPSEADPIASSSRQRSSSPARRRRQTSPNEQAVDPDRTIRPNTLRTAAIEASMDREVAVLGAKIDQLHIERELLLAQVHAESQVRAEGGSNLDPNHRTRQNSPRREDQQPRQFGREVRHWQPTQAFPPVPPPAARSSPAPVGDLLPRPPEDYDGSMSMDLATPLIPTAMLPVAGPSTLSHPAGSANFHIAPFLPTPVSTEISPLDLSADYPLPAATSPSNETNPQTWGATGGAVDTRQQLPPGEQAVQELMGIARRRA
ncbi:hypothetical protein K438DRAFT_2017033 [Mycena galopus ATCC 62051]|nr:hypothetical protein K438DRAFT_2017033 [Mycena galopus ATCC 62051]